MKIRLIKQRPVWRPGVTRAEMEVLWLAALVPVLFMSLFNTGFQALNALKRLGGFGEADWRERAYFVVTQDLNAAGFWDFLWAGAVHVLPLWAVTFAVSWVWEALFAHFQARKREAGFVAHALVFIFLLPPATPLVHAALGISFGTVLGRLIFGGARNAFLHPAVLGAAVLMVSFPNALTTHALWESVQGYGGTAAFKLWAEGGRDALFWAGLDTFRAFAGTVPGTIGTTSALAVLLGGALLFYVKLADWRLAVAMLLGAGLMSLATSEGPPLLQHLVQGGFAFAAVFVLTDGACAAHTRPGRWMQGLLAGALIVLVRELNPAHPDGVVAVLLFVSIAAPALDALARKFTTETEAHRHA